MNKYYCSQLRKFRKNLDKRKTQEEFSEDIRLSCNFYGKIEIGRSTPSLQSHIDICLKLDKPSDCFLNENMSDIVLSEEALNHLKSLDINQLKTLSEILRLIYEKNKFNSSSKHG